MVAKVRKNSIYLIPIFFLLLNGCARPETVECESIDRINTSLSPDFLYTLHTETLPEERLVLGSIDSTDTYNDSIIIKQKGWNFYCADNLEPAIQVEYYYHSKPCRAGDWYYRYAYLCGEKYYIFDGKDCCGGNGLYGPFDVR